MMSRLCLIQHVALHQEIYNVTQVFIDPTPGCSSTLNPEPHPACHLVPQDAVLVAPCQTWTCACALGSASGTTNHLSQQMIVTPPSSSLTVKVCLLPHPHGSTSYHPLFERILEAARLPV